MSALQWPFRVLDTGLAAQAEVARHCRRAGLDLVDRSATHAGARIRFEVTSPDLRLTVQVPVAACCPSDWPEMQGLAWPDRLDESFMAAFEPSTGWLDRSIAAFAQAEIRVLGTLDPTAERDAVALAAVEGPRGPIWVEHARSTLPDAAAAVSMASLSMPLDLQIARVAMPLQRVANLSTGAALLLPALQPVALLGSTRLFHFNFTLEALTVTTTLDFLDDDADGVNAVGPGSDAQTAVESEASTAPRLDINRLTVDVEVVLCRLPSTLAEIAELQAGSVLALPQDAWKQLQLRVNGQCIGRGELVQVGDQLAVQLHGRVAQP